MLLGVSSMFAFSQSLPCVKGGGLHSKTEGLWYLALKKSGGLWPPRFGYSPFARSFWYASNSSFIFFTSFFHRRSITIQITANKKAIMPSAMA